MSAYYGNLLPPSQLPSGGGGSTALGDLASFTHDNKFDSASNFYSSSPAGMRYGEDASPIPGQHFPRFPPYDRIDAINPINASKGYTTPVSVSSYQTSGLYSSQNGQYHGSSAEDLTKPPTTGYHGDVGSTSPPMGVPPTSHPQAGMVPSPFGHQNLNGMMHAAQAQAQNIPIYPWMRPMNGGKSSQVIRITPIQKPANFRCLFTFFSIHAAVVFTSVAFIYIIYIAASTAHAHAHILFISRSLLSNRLSVLRCTL
jgi:hypothetical protein